MRILITGGAGYVGSALVEDLLAGAHEVGVLDNLRSGDDSRRIWLERQGVQYIAGDVRDTAVVRDAVARYDGVVHLAAVVGYPACDADPEAAVSINVGGTQSVLKAAAGRPVVVASSLSCLGKVGAVSCDETTVPYPVSLYGETKREAELLALDSGDAVVLRPATAFGVAPSMRFDLLVNQFTREAVTRGELKVYEPDAMRCFVHVRDLAHAMAFSITNADRLRGELFHVGNDELNYTKRELAELISEATGCRVVIHEASTDKDQRDYAGDFGKLTAAGLTLRRSLLEGVREVRHVVESAGLPAQPGVHD